MSEKQVSDKLDYIQTWRTLVPSKKLPSHLQGLQQFIWHRLPQLIRACDDPQLWKQAQIGLSCKTGYTLSPLQSRNLWLENITPCCFSKNPFQTKGIFCWKCHTQLLPSESSKILSKILVDSFPSQRYLVNIYFTRSLVNIHYVNHTPNTKLASQSHPLVKTLCQSALVRTPSPKLLVQSSKFPSTNPQEPQSQISSSSILSPNSWAP